MPAPPSQCTKCQTTDIAGGWVANLTTEGGGLTVTHARGLCASCAAGFPDEAARVAFVAQVAGEREKALREAGAKHQGVMQAIREHFTPCRHCGGSDTVVKNNRQIRERQTVRTQQVAVGCKSCGAVFLDVQGSGEEDLPGKVLAELQRALPGTTPPALEGSASSSS